MSAYAAMPADGEPIVGPVAEVPGLYLAVMHPAVTLASAVGRLVARELVGGTVEPALTGCRLGPLLTQRHQHAARAGHCERRGTEPPTP